MCAQLTATHSAPVIRRPQGALTLWHGLTFGNFCRLMSQRPPVDVSRWGRLASIGAASVVNSFYNTLENAVYGRKIDATPIPEEPVFILGHWRSGTTLLHNLMTLDDRYCFPNLYQCMFPGHFLLTESAVTTATAPLVPTKRPMDDMPAGWKLPQEDEVALVLTTLLSPYIQVLHPNNRPQYDAFYTLTDITPEERSRWKEAFIRMTKKLVMKSGKPPIMKSPTHTFRVPLLLEMFPNAKFVYIHRHPYSVCSSTMHLRRTMHEENGLSKAHSTDPLEDVFISYDRLFHTFERDKALIPDQNLCTIRFDRLEQDPVGQMLDVYEALGLEMTPEMHQALELRLPALKGHRKNRFELADDVKARIFERLRPVFEVYGYDSGFENQAKVA